MVNPTKTRSKPDSNANHIGYVQNDHPKTPPNTIKNIEHQNHQKQLKMTKNTSKTSSKTHPNHQTHVNNKH
jgi:hypothetical protein